MLLNENITLHAELIARYLNGEMDNAELSGFESRWLNEPENKLLIQEMKKQWNSLENYAEIKDPATRRAWDKLHSRLKEDNLISEKSVRTVMLPGRQFLRIAAAILVLLAMAAVLYYTVNPGAKPEMLSIRTGNDERTLIKTLSDGSVIYLAQNTSFSFPKEFERHGRNVELKGEAFFDIAHDESKPFIIETDEAIIQVIGTAFTVKTTNGSDFELLVERGKVKVTPRENPSLNAFVVAGEKIAISDKHLVKTKQLPGESALWYTRHMQFKDETLKNVIHVLNRNFNTKFATAGMEVGNRRLTITFTNESVETMNELLCLTLNLQSQLKNDSIVLSQTRGGTKEN